MQLIFDERTSWSVGLLEFFRKFRWRQREIGAESDIGKYSTYSNIMVFFFVVELLLEIFKKKKLELCGNILDRNRRLSC